MICSKPCLFLLACFAMADYYYETTQWFFSWLYRVVTKGQSTSTASEGMVGKIERVSLQVER